MSMQDTCFKRLALVLLCAAASLAAFAQNDSGAVVNQYDEVRLPDNIIHEELSNGLDYVLVENKTPENMLEFRLIFKSGSMLENDKNRGAAHFLEHMAFKGTDNFPDREMVEYLESLGVQYGIGINAFTGYDRTIYMFSLPYKSKSDIHKGLLILKDWLVGITLNKAKVESEKGVILEELRGYDVGDPFYDLKIGNGKYSEGIPLGTEDDIRKIKPSVLKKFHSDWYTLGQAAIAIVGDADMKEIETSIHQMFGPLKATRSPRFKNYPLTYEPGINQKSIKDEFTKRTTLEYMIPHPCVHSSDMNSALEVARRRVLMLALGRRFSQTDVHVMATNEWYLADKEHFVLTFCEDGKEEVLNSMKDAYAEINRVLRDGFTSSEIAYATNVIAESLNNITPSSSSQMICDDIVDHVIFNDRRVTCPDQKEWLCKQVEAITSEELVSTLKSWIELGRETSLLAYKYNPEYSEDLGPSAIEAAIKSASELRQEAYQPKQIKEELTDCMPAAVIIPANLLVKADKVDPSMIKSRRYYDNLGITEVEFANGFRLIARPTKDEEDKIQIQMLAPGGLSLIPRDKFPVYEDVAGYMELGGIEAFEDDDLYEEMLIQNGLGIVLATENYWHGLIASGPSDKAPLLFNTIREKMLHPRLDYKGFQELIDEDLESLGEESYLQRLIKHDYERQLGMKIDEVMGSLLYGRRNEKVKADLETADLAKIAEYYHHLYSNPNGMTAVVCGSFEVEDIIAQTAYSFGSIPPGEPHHMGESGYEIPQQPNIQSWPNDKENQTLFDYLYYGQYEPSLRGGMTLKIMNALIRNRLISILRERESLVYSPYVSLYYNAHPDRFFYFDINASVDRKNTKEVVRLLEQIITSLQTDLVSDEEIESIRRNFKVNKAGYLEEDATANWRGHIITELKAEESLADFNDYDNILESISATDIREAFRQLISVDRYQIFSIGEM